MIVTFIIVNNLHENWFLQGYTVTIHQLGTQSQASNLDIDEENYTVSLDYDCQAQRITVQLKFIYEGCYHATIKYKDTELHNGDFDIIVLNSKWMVFVVLFPYFEGMRGITAKWSALFV